MSGYCYLDVETNAVFEETYKSDLFKVKNIITENLKELFGECGSKYQVDILKYEHKKGRIILRCPADFYVKLRSALALAFSIKENKVYCFRVRKSSSSLISLLSDSRRSHILNKENVFVQKGR